jgi:hypothetical protein
MEIETFPLPHPEQIVSYDEVVSLIDEFCMHFARFQPEYSFAHIVLDDYNLSDHWINSCLSSDETSAAQAGFIVQFLNYLLTIPEPLRTDDGYE